MEETCPLKEPLRVNIPNDQFTTNGFHEGYEPWRARFESQTGWIAASPSSAETDYMQIEFNRYVAKMYKEISYFIFPLFLMLKCR